MGGEIIARSAKIAIIAKIEKTKSTAEGGCATRTIRRNRIEQMGQLVIE